MGVVPNDLACLRLAFPYCFVEWDECLCDDWHESMVEINYTEEPLQPRLVFRLREAPDVLDSLGHGHDAARCDPVAKEI